MPDQSRANAALLDPRHHAQRTEDLHLNQPPRSIEQTPAEHDMPNDLPVILGNHRETSLSRDAVPQAVDQVSHHKAMINKRPQVNIPHPLPVPRNLFPKIHPWRVKTPPPAAHTI